MEDRKGDVDCPSLLCEEKVEDLETKNGRGIMGKTRRDGEGEVFNQREDEEAGGVTGSENKDGEEEEKEKQVGSMIQEVAAVSSADSSALSEPPIGLINSCGLSDPAYPGCGGTRLYCPPVPVPLLYSSQPPVPPNSHMLPHSLPQQGPQPLEIEITQVHSSQLQKLETVNSCLLPPAPKKRRQIRYSTDQLEYLEAWFLEDPYPDAEKKKIIAAAIGVTPRQVKVWFQNRRAKWRKVVRSITAKVEHSQSRVGYNSSPTHQPINSTLPTLAPNSKGAPSLSGHFAIKVPQLTSTAPSSPTLSNQTVPSHSNLLPSLNGPVLCLTLGRSSQNNNLPYQLETSDPTSQSQSTGQILLQSAGHHDGIAEITPARASSPLPSQDGVLYLMCPKYF